ncbi:OB-fold domain-containing protein [Novosphingobium sp. G106]|uniref:Zn-ribbon domain-containing OB-fold protein n=1 Tax=Novosphingobium sp. G106 TaxID=2849500 RepID=UPI001C2D2940|nr:OB-fold domain-containing protein [Novosphingobium sp. G106]MBV1688224.1 OB-fold domain-containing protein [Novosphingobium sp. G106]
MTSRPLPVPDEMSAPYWAACAEHVLTLPRCSDCREFTMPPDSTCPNCHSFDPRFTFEPVSGAGKVRTWTVMRRSFLQGFDTPFMLVDVQLDDQPKVRLIGRLLDGPETPVKAGDRVAVAFEDLAPGISVPAFTLERAA